VLRLRKKSKFHSLAALEASGPRNLSFSSGV
jgi:hypothetical protein